MQTPPPTPPAAPPPTVNFGEPGNVFEREARQALQHQLDPADYLVLHPNAMSEGLTRLVFTNEPIVNEDLKCLVEEIRLLRHDTQMLENSDRSTQIGVDVVILPVFDEEDEEYDVEMATIRVDIMRKKLEIGEIKLKFDGVVDAAAMGSTAHRMVLMEREGIRRRWVVVTNIGARLAPMLTPVYEHVYEVDVTAEIVHLKALIANASLDGEKLCALVEGLCTAWQPEAHHMCAAALECLEYVTEYRKRRLAAAMACLDSKSTRLDSSRNAALAALKKRKRAGR